MSGITDNSDTEILRPDTNLADDVKLYPSMAFGGKDAAVAIKAGNQVCWNCFTVLAGDFTDLVMGHALVRFCKSKKCHKVCAQMNARREQEQYALATKIITSGSGS